MAGRQITWLDPIWFYKRLRDFGLNSKPHEGFEKMGVATFAFMWKEVKEMGQFQLAASSWSLSARLLLFWIIIGQLKYYCRWQSKEVGFSLNYLVHVSSHFRALTFEKWLPWTRCINMCGCSCNPALSVYDWFFDSILNVGTTDMWFSNFYSLWSKGQQS